MYISKIQRSHTPTERCLGSCSISSSCWLQLQLSPERAKLELHKGERLGAGKKVLLAGSAATTVLFNHVATLLGCRFDFSFSGDASAGVFNPAATWTSEHGWVFTFRRDLCFYQQCGIHHTNTTVHSSIPYTTVYRGLAWGHGVAYLVCSFWSLSWRETILWSSCKTCQLQA